MSRFILPFQSVFDKNGHPLDGAKLYFYETGTSTLKDTYSDLALSTANANPVIADSQGQFGDIYLDGEYSVELKDKNDVTQPGYPDTINNTDTQVDTLRTELASTGAGEGSELVSYNNDVTGGVNTTVDEKLKEIITIGVEFGATLDGSTDNTTIIDAVIANVPNGTLIIIPNLCKYYYQNLATASLTKINASTIGLLDYSRSLFGGAAPWLFASRHFAIAGDIDMFNPGGSGSDLTWIDEDGDATKELCIMVHEYGKHRLNMKVSQDKIDNVDAVNGSAVIQRSTGGTISFLGAFANVTDQGSWTTSTAYSVNDVVLESSVYYRCVFAHTSGTFATDLASPLFWVVQDKIRIKRETHTIKSVTDASNLVLFANYAGDTESDLIAMKLGLNTALKLIGGDVPEVEISNYLTIQGENDQGLTAQAKLFFRTWDSTDGYEDVFKAETDSGRNFRMYARNTAGNAWVACIGFFPGDTPTFNFQNAELAGNLNFDSTSRKISLGGPQILAGAGTPEGNISAPVGSTYMRTDGATGTSFYVKESGSSSAGWVAK